MISSVAACRSGRRLTSGAIFGLVGAPQSSAEKFRLRRITAITLACPARYRGSIPLGAATDTSTVSVDKLQWWP